MSKVDYERTPDGYQRVTDGNVKVEKALYIPVFTGSPTLNDNTNEPGAVGLNSDGKLIVYNGTAWVLSDAGASADLAAETTAREAADTTLQTNINAKQNALGFTPENVANKNAANGYAGLDGGGKVAAAQLPSYVDDVLEYSTLSALPGTGETGKIYVTLDTNFEYRWSGSTYIRIVASPGTTDALAEGSTNLYFTVARVIASALTGIGFSTATVVLATDTILQALGKLQAQITALLKIPVGGAATQVLSKIDSADGHTQWVDHTLQAVTNNGNNTTANITSGTVVNQIKTLYFIGDSNTTGYGLSDTNVRWSTILCKMLKCNEVNNAVSGMTLENASPAGSGGSILTQLSLVPTYDSLNSYLIINLGTNDIDLSGISGATYSQSGFTAGLTTLLAQAVTNGWPVSRVIFANPPFIGTYQPSGTTTSNTTTSLTYNATLKAFALANGCPYIDLYTPTTNNGGTSLMQADGLHNNPGGHYIKAVAAKTFFDGLTVFGDATISGNLSVGQLIGFPAVFNLKRTVSATLNNYVEIGQITEPPIDIHGNGLTTMRLKVIISADGSPSLMALTLMEFDIAPHFWIANGSWVTVNPTVRTGLGSNAIIYTNLQAYYTNIGDGNGYLKLRLNNNIATNGVATTFNISIYVFRPANCGFTPLYGTGTDATAYGGYQVNIYQDHNLAILHLYATNGINFLSGIKINGSYGSAGQAMLSNGSSLPTWATVLQAANNLSDLNNIQTALQNLGLPAAYNVVRVLGSAANSYTEIGTVNVASSDVNGWTLNECVIKIIMSSDAPGGTTVGFNGAAMEFNFRGNFWQSNGTWQNVSPTEMNGLGSNTLQSVSIQALLNNPGNNTASVKFRIFQGGSIGTGWNVSLYVYRPQNSSFTPLSGTGTDATSYPSYSAYRVDYITKEFDVFGILYAYAGIGLFGNMQLNGLTSGNTQLKAAAIAAGSVTLPAALPSSAGQNVQSDASGNWSYANTSVYVASGDFTGQTATKTIVTFTVGVATAFFRIGGYINITAIATDVIQLQVSYTDENSTSQTAVFFNQGTTVAGMSTVGNSSFPSMGLRCKNGTTITVSATLTTSSGSITFDCGARIQQL